MSTKYVAPYLLEKRFKEELAKVNLKNQKSLEKQAIAIAKRMKKKKYPVEEIAKLKGLSEKEIGGM